MVVVYLHPHGRLTTRQFTSHRERGLHTFLQVAVAPKYPDFFRESPRVPLLIGFCVLTTPAKL